MPSLRYDYKGIHYGINENGTPNENAIVILEKSNILYTDARTIEININEPDFDIDTLLGQDLTNDKKYRHYFVVSKQVNNNNQMTLTLSEDIFVNYLDQVQLDKLEVEREHSDDYVEYQPIEKNQTFKVSQKVLKRKPIVFDKQDVTDFYENYESKVNIFGYVFVKRDDAEGLLMTLI